MKLPIGVLTTQQQLEEFDIWVTASLGEIRDTDRFKEELARIAAHRLEVEGRQLPFQLLLPPLRPLDV